MSAQAFISAAGNMFMCKDGIKPFKDMDESQETCQESVIPKSNTRKKHFDFLQRK